LLLYAIETSPELNCKPNFNHPDAEE